MNADSLNTVSLPELQQQLATQCNISDAEAQRFIHELFAVVEDELCHGRSIKIKGIGSFAVSTADDRQTVSFTPDSHLATELNAPFAMFQPLPLPEGTDISFDDDEADDSTEVEQPEEEQQPAVDEQEEVTQEEGEEESEEEITPLEEPQEEEISDEEISDEEISEEDIDEELDEVDGDDIDTADEIEEPAARPHAPAYISNSVSRARHDRDPYVRRGRSRRFLRGLAVGLGFGILIGVIIGLLLYKPLTELMGFDLVSTEMAVAAGQQASPVPPRQLSAVPAPIDSAAVARRAAQLARAAAAAAEAKSAVVRDTVTNKRYLATMARDHYGCMEYWIYIYRANRALGHPDRVEPGTIVTIPPKESFMRENEKATRDEATRLTHELYAKYKN